MPSSGPSRWAQQLRAEWHALVMALARHVGMVDNAPGIRAVDLCLQLIVTVQNLLVPTPGHVVFQLLVNDRLRQELTVTVNQSAMRPRAQGGRRR